MAERKEPSPEVRAIIKKFVEVNREKYGPDWKKIVSKQMADASRPYVEAILKMGKKHG